MIIKYKDLPSTYSIAWCREFKKALESAPDTYQIQPSKELLEFLFERDKSIAKNKLKKQISDLLGVIVQ